MASVLNKSQLDELRKRLEDERARLLRVLRTPKASPPGNDQERELEEAAQRATERAQELAVEERERALLREVERALRKLDEGTYGVSEKTGDPIPYERLAALPWARTAVDEA